MTTVSVSSGNQFNRFISLIIFSLVIGILLGGVLFLTSKAIYLIIVSITLAAIIAGVALVQAIHFTKTRNKLIVVVAALIMGLSLYGTYRYAEYLDFMNQAHQEFADTKWETARIDKFINERLREETGSTGFVGFVRLNAQEGMTMSNDDTASSPTELSTEMTVAYWVLEILIIIGVPVFIGINATSDRFCEETNEWLKYNRVGWVIREDASQFLQLIKSDNLSAAQPLITDNSTTKAGSLIIYVGRCTDYSTNAFIKVDKNQSKRVDNILNQEITAAQYNRLQIN